MRTDSETSGASKRFNLELKTMLGLTALCAVCFAILVQSDNKYRALNWILPPLIIFSHTHRSLGCAHLFARLTLALLIGVVLYFPEVWHDTDQWEQNHQAWIATHPSNFDAPNENLRALFGFIPASIYAGLLVLVSALVSYLLTRWQTFKHGSAGTR